MTHETGFEKLRGISGIEVREGYAQVHVSRLHQPIYESRLNVLRALASAELSLDFLKFTPSGLSCLIPESGATNAEKALNSLNVHFSVRLGRSVLLVHAVNMRDEEGLISQIVMLALNSGARIEHVSDTHDRVLLVVHSEDIQIALESLKKISASDAEATS